MMPKSFEDCVKSGGKVVTKKLKNNRYIHICYDKNGNSYSGEVKTKKRKNIVWQKKKNNVENGKNLQINRTNSEVVNNAKATLEDLKKLKEHFDSMYR